MFKMFKNILRSGDRLYDAAIIYILFIYDVLIIIIYNYSRTKIYKTYIPITF